MNPHRIKEIFDNADDVLENIKHVKGEIYTSTLAETMFVYSGLNGILGLIDNEDAFNVGAFISAKLLSRQVVLITKAHGIEDKDVIEEIASEAMRLVKLTHQHVNQEIAS